MGLRVARNVARSEARNGGRLRLAHGAERTDFELAFRSGWPIEIALDVGAPPRHKYHETERRYSSLPPDPKEFDRTMPRRNLRWLTIVALVSIVCYRKADSGNRTKSGQLYDTFNTVMSKIKDNYVGEVNDRELFEGALQGMVSRLDPYSAFIPPQDYKELQESLKGMYGGVGIEVRWESEGKFLLVMSALPDTPASRAGLKSGDRIVKIDDEATADFQDIEQAFHRLRGEVGTRVRATYIRGTDPPREITLTRAEIKVDTVIGHERRDDGHWNFFLAGEDRVAYLRITTFGESTVDELKAALELIEAEGARGLVLDLRYNSGGLLTSGVETCMQFVGEGLIVSIRGKHDSRNFQASGPAPCPDLPMACLTNHFTASASEIVAACLQDHKRAVIVGERTFGKGSVQDVIPLEDGVSSLKLTTAGYWRPSGKNIHREKNAKETDEWGVSPNEGFAVPAAAPSPPAPPSPPEPPATRAESDAAEDPQAPPADPQLNKAVEYLRGRAGANDASATTAESSSFSIPRRVGHVARV